MAFYEDVSTVTLGSTSITTVKSISSNLSAPMTGTGGDADEWDTAKIRGRRSRTGQIVMADVAQAQDLVGDEGTLGFIAKNQAGSSDETFAVVGVEITDIAINVAHAAEATATLSWMAMSADGTTDPQSSS